MDETGTNGLRIVAIILSLYVLAFPGLTLVTLAFLLVVVLFVGEIGRVISILFLQGMHRWTNIGLGILSFCGFIFII